MAEFEQLEIGKEMPPLEPAKVKIVATEEREVPNYGKKLVLKVNHPSKEGVEIGKAKFEVKGKLKSAGLWLKKDVEGKLQGNSAIAHLLRFYKAAKISELVDKEIETAADDKGFLLAKAY